MNNKTLVLLASILLVVPFVLLIIGCIIHIYDDKTFETSTLGCLIK